MYFDDLLNALIEAKVCCFIGNIFVGVFAYADDVVTLEPKYMTGIISKIACCTKKEDTILNSCSQNK